MCLTGTPRQDTRPMQNGEEEAVKKTIGLLFDGMRKGDGVLFYHSSCAVPGVAGIAEVATSAYADPTQFDPKSAYFDAGSPRDAPRWLMVDVKYKRKLKRVITLTELKQHDELNGMILLRPGNRLSVMPVTAPEWDFVLGLE